MLIVCIKATCSIALLEPVNIPCIDKNYNLYLNTKKFFIEVGILSDHLAIVAKLLNMTGSLAIHASQSDCAVNKT